MKKKRDYVGYLMYFLKILVPAIVAVFILRGFFLIPVRVDGHSMQKTLNQGDMIVMEKFSAIKRFDVVVFKTDTGSILINRVIGLPGEAVRYENDQLYVNNQPIAEPYLTKNRKKDHETMPYTTNFDSKELLMQEKLPKDSYFVLGDNRRMSKDSRSFGAIHADQILGKAQFVYYPLTHMKIIPK